MATEILLGFEVGSGERIMLPLHHTVVTGMTQLSGKTTTLEALIDRGKITAIAFLTKRGELGFKGQRVINPYFKEQKKGDLIDWQYVEAILEATMGERMKFERSWIIDSCQGSSALGTSPAHSLEEVYNNIRKGQEDSKRALDQSVFTNLSAYFEIILPQIKKYSFSERLDLKPGFNVMNLIGMKDEMQQLVIESAIAYVLKRLEHVVIVLPEAHKFIPQGSKTPVKGTAVRYIQEGAVLGNYLWVDTQVTTTVDKDLLKQCGNWIMGYQQERNEVANVRENVGKVIKEEQITSLKLGHFMALLEKKVYHVYVLPAGISDDIGRSVALGRMSVEEVRDQLKTKGNGRVFDASMEKPFHKVVSYHGEEKDLWDPIEMRDKHIQGLEERIVGLNKEIEELKKRPTIEQFNQALENLKQTITKANEVVFTSYTKSKDEEMAKKDEEIRIKDEALKEYEHLKILVGDIIANYIWPLMEPLMEPYLEDLLDVEKVEQLIDKKLKNEDFVKQVAGIVEAQLQTLPTKQRRHIETIGETQIPWVNLWLSKSGIGTAEQKILRKMAEMYPLKMTKAQIAIKVGLTVKGGYFNGAFNNLMKWKLLKAEGDQYILAEGPPG